MSLAAFGYSAYSGPNEKRIFIVGGFDGKILHSQAWNIDLLQNSVSDIMIDGVDYGLSFSKVAYFKMEGQKKENEKGELVKVQHKIDRLYIFGGYNSAGDSYVYDFLVES